MNRFTMSNLALLMSYKVSPKEIGKAVDRLEIEPSDNLFAVSPDTVHIAAVQLLIRRYSSLQEYVTDMNSYVADAVNRRAQLVVFPAYAGLLPVSLTPQFDKGLAAVQPKPGSPWPDPVELHKNLSYFSDFAFDAWSGTMSALAARHRVYILAGSTLYFAGDQLCHRAFLYGEDGQLVGFQDKLSVTSIEQEMGVEPAAELRLFDLPVGPACILTGGDADYFLLARIARNLGAKVLLSPNAFTGEYTPVQSALGLNMRAQENRVFGVQSVLCGDTGLGFSVEGGCAVFAPNELVRQKNGVLARATAGLFEPDVICPPLMPENLERTANPYTQDHNRRLLDEHADRLY